MPPRIRITGPLRQHIPARPMPPATRSLSSTPRRLADDESTVPPPAPSTNPPPSNTAPSAPTPSPAPSPFAPSMTRGPPPRPGQDQQQQPQQQKPASPRSRMLQFQSLDLLEQQRKRQQQAQRQARQHVAQSRAQQAQEKARTTHAAELRASSDELMALMGLRLHTGDVYSPQDLTPGEMRHYLGRKALGRGPRESDEIEVTGVNPLDMYRNFTLIDHWRTTAGRIKHSRETGYKPKNQRKIARAVRRAVGLALIPSTRPHPEKLARDLQPISEITERMRERQAHGAIKWK